jgi:hypothetical protein
MIKDTQVISCIKEKFSWQEYLFPHLLNINARREKGFA